MEEGKKTLTREDILKKITPKPLKYELNGETISIINLISNNNILNLEEIITKHKGSDKDFCEKVLSLFIENQSNIKYIFDSEDEEILKLLTFFIENRKNYKNFYNSFDKYLKQNSFNEFKKGITSFVTQWLEEMNKLTQITSPLIKTNSMFEKLNIPNHLKSISKVSGKLNNSFNVFDKFKSVMPKTPEIKIPSSISNFKSPISKMLEAYSSEKPILQPMEIRNKSFGSNEISHEQFEEDIKNDIREDEQRFNKSYNCNTCNNKTDDLMCYYEVKQSENNRKIIFCSRECLLEYFDTNKIEIIQIDEVSRCVAYFRCKEIGNLRKMCTKKETIQGEYEINILCHENFCAPANAGIILSSHKIISSLREFDEKVTEQQEELITFLKKFKLENDKQSKFTLTLTLLVIFLTVVSLIFAGIAFFDKIPQGQLSELQQIAKYSNNKNILLKQQSVLEQIEKELKSNKNSDKEKVILIGNLHKLLKETSYKTDSYNDKIGLLIKEFKNYLEKNDNVGENSKEILKKIQESILEVNKKFTNVEKIHIKGGKKK